MNTVLNLFVAAVLAGTPLLFGTVGEIMNEKVGHLNLGVEGMMSIGCLLYTSTDQENSLVCPTEFMPDDMIEREDGWRAFRIQGILDFSLIGILAEISSMLADHKIGIFVISTYNTDYILTKAENFERAVRVLSLIHI